VQYDRKQRHTVCFQLFDKSRKYPRPTLNCADSNIVYVDCSFTFISIGSCKHETNDFVIRINSYPRFSTLAAFSDYDLDFSLSLWPIEWNRYFRSNFL
jgi:hypothetical protein